MNSELADALVDVLDLPIVRTKLVQLFEYDYSEDLNAAMTAANDALNRNISEGVVMSGKLDRAGPVELEVRDQLLFLAVFGSGVAVVDVQE